MKVLKKSTIIIILGILSLALSTVTFIKNSQANGAEPHIKVEVTSDGVTWYNYFGTEYSGSQTLALNSGDTLWARVKIWNTGAGILNISGIGSISSFDYFQDIPEYDVDLDADENGNFFTANYFIGGTGSINNVAALGSEGTAEIMLIKVTLVSNVPADTVITGTANITSAVEPTQGGEEEVSLFGVGRAKAQESLESNFRIIVNQTLPRTGADL